MKLRITYLAVLAVVSAACESTTTPKSSAASAAAAEPVPSLSEQARRLALASRPGGMHAALAPLTGTWDVTVVDTSSAAGEGETFHGEGSLAWVLGGRFLHWEASVDLGGTLRTTTGYLGYDPRTAQYQLMMVSDLAAGMGVAHGTGMLANAGIVFVLEQLDPMTGASLRARSRLRLVSEDHFTLEQLGESDRSARTWHYRRRLEPKR